MVNNKLTVNATETANFFHSSKVQMDRFRTFMF